MDILKKLPASYRVMGKFDHSGVVVVQTIINCRDGDSNQNPLKLYPQESWLQQTLASAGLLTIETMTEILLEKGFKVIPVDYETKTLAQREKFLKDCVESNHRVVLLTRRKSVLGVPRFFPQYITIEGYCGDKFFAFDPSVRKPGGGLLNRLPCGNCEIGIGELLERWRPNPLFKILNIKGMTGVVAILVNNPTTTSTPN